MNIFFVPLTWYCSNKKKNVHHKQEKKKESVDEI